MRLAGNAGDCARIQSGSSARDALEMHFHCERQAQSGDEYRITATGKKMARYGKCGKPCGKAMAKLQRIAENFEASDLAWVASPDVAGRAPELARELLETNRVLEYECYDNSHRGQGRAVVTLKEWDDRGSATFTGEHGPSSDGYYAYFVESQMGKDGVLLLTPAVMVEIPYLRAMWEKLGEDALADFARRKKSEAPAPVPEAGTGLEAALQREVGRVPREEGDGPKERLRDRSRSPKGDKDPVQEYIERQASKQKEKRQERRKEDKARSKKKKKDRKKKGDATETSSGSSGKSSSSGFQLSPVRGGQELWRVAQKKPGRLTQKALSEMTRYLAARSEEGEPGDRWTGQKVQAYLNQITFGTHPPAKAGLRTARELTTLAVALDCLLSGKLSQASDVLIQRYKALETSLGEGGQEVRESFEEEPSKKSSSRSRQRKRGRSDSRREAGQLQRGQDRSGPKRGRGEAIRLQEAEPSTREVRMEREEKRRKRESPAERRIPMVERERSRPRSQRRSTTPRPRPDAAGGGLEESGDEGTAGKVRELVDWLRSNGGEHLTAAQVSQHLIIQAIALNGRFGQLLEMSLRPTQESEGRVRNLMRLPLWPDARDAIEEVVLSLKYRDQPGDWRSRGETKSKANKALRVEGLLRWHGLVVIGLNLLYSEGSSERARGPPGGQATRAQGGAMVRIWNLVKTFVDEKVPKSGVPRTPKGDWAEEMEKLKISYSGEVVERSNRVYRAQTMEA
eukprot:Skav226691  [mRNA]  locus=scaffold3971:131026:134560:- [translate_table: standard]